MPYKDKDAQRAYQREWVKAKGKDTFARAKVAQRDRMRAMVNDLKKGPCIDCGAEYPPYVMQFDHIGNDKVMNVSELVARNASRERILVEIDKCELVCSNCHAERTHARR